MLDLVQTFAILNLQKQRHSCCKDDKNNKEISFFESIILLPFLYIAIPLALVAGVIYLFYYLISSACEELKNEKSEFMDNKTFFKFLIPITIILSTLITIIIKLLN
jgi:hypothetical protein